MTPIIDPNTKLNVILDLDPRITDYIVSLNPHDFERLYHPLMRRFMAPRITLGRVAQMTQRPVAELLHRIAEITNVDTALTFPEIEMKSCGTRPNWISSVPANQLSTVNLLPADESLDVDPLPPITRAIHRLHNDDVLLIKHKWEPQPLYDIWARTGIVWYTEQKGPDEWWIWVKRDVQPKGKSEDAGNGD